MTQHSQYSSAGEDSNPNPFGRGCFPFTVLVGLTLALGGGLGWWIYDWIGLTIGVVVVLAGWIHFIWS